MIFKYNNPLWTASTKVREFLQRYNSYFCGGGELGVHLRCMTSTVVATDEPIGAAGFSALVSGNRRSISDKYPNPSLIRPDKVPHIISPQLGNIP